MAGSPYSGLPENDWQKKTEDLVNAHPLGIDEFRTVVLQAWSDIFQSRLGPKKFRIGKDIFPKPQIMGFFLHELVPLEFAARYPKDWRAERAKQDKDLVYVPDDRFSVEIKTSSHPSQVFGNRSYAQKGETERNKNKSGYYLTANFEKFIGKGGDPKILLIRFGWLDHSDWVGQTSTRGQQAHLTPAADRHKLLTIYRAE